MVINNIAACYWMVSLCVNEHACTCVYCGWILGRCYKTVRLLFIEEQIIFLDRSLRVKFLIFFLLFPKNSPIPQELDT